MTSEQGRNPRFGTALAIGLCAWLAGCTALPTTSAVQDQPEATRSAVIALDTVPTWPAFPTNSRYRHAGVPLGSGRALVCGGKGNTDVYPANCELLQAQGGALTASVYPLPSDPDTSGVPVAQGRVDLTLTLLPAGGVLLAGGRPGPKNLDRGAQPSLPIADWLQADDNPNRNWLPAETMIVAREAHTATLLGTSVAVVGGYTPLTQDEVGEIEVRSELSGVDASWKIVPSSEPRVGHSATLLKAVGSEARVLILGGYNKAQGYLKSGFIFSLESGVAPIAELPSPRAYHTATLLDDEHGSVLVVGGEFQDSGGIQHLGEALLYDPVTDKWKTANFSSVFLPRSHHSAVRLGGYVIVAGGEGPGAPGANTNQALQSVQAFDPQLAFDSTTSAAAWTDLRSLSNAREDFQLLSLSETQLVASGGWRVNGGDSPPNSELITLWSLGQPSSDGTLCASGHASDGVCCESDCSDSCHACDAAGTCQAVTGEPRVGHSACAGGVQCSVGACPERCDATTHLCPVGSFCNAQGSCSAQKPIGGSCQGSAECAQGVCVDITVNSNAPSGVCCESACSGSCESCNDKGLCRALAKGDRPLPSHPSCSSGGDGNPLCAARCDGIQRDRCVFPGSESACSAASCDQGKEQPARSCDGQGTCQDVPAERCEPYACGTNQCLTRCRGNEDCATTDQGVPLAHCEVGSGTCLRCDQDKCKGYQCDRQTDECLNSCQKSETDCVGGYYCHPLSHRCVEVVTFPVGELSACALGTSRVPNRGFAAAVATALLLTARRRRHLRRGRARS